MSRSFGYSSIESKYDNLKIKYDSMKDDINNNIIAKISSTYEESVICFQDYTVVKKIIDSISNFYGLIAKISEAKEVSAIKNYENTTTSLDSLNSKVNELISKLNDLHVSISKASMEAHKKLIDDYTTEKDKYNTYCSDIDSYFRSYNSSYSKYNRTKALINDTLQSDPGYKGLCKDRDDAYKDMQEFLDSIDDTISKQLNPVKINLQNLLKDGLEKNGWIV